MDIAIASLTLEVRDPAASQEFLRDRAWGWLRVQARVAGTPATGFRGFTISLVVGQPSAVDSLLGAALGGGGKTLKPAQKGL